MNIINIKTVENITYKLYYNNTKEETWGVELEQLLIEELEEIYAISSVKKEFRKAVDEAWRKRRLGRDIRKIDCRSGSFRIGKRSSD